MARGDGEPQADRRRDYLIRLGALRSERSQWFSHWREISQYLLPRTGRFLDTDRGRGAKKNNSIYDSTGTRALRVLAAGMMAGMTSPARPWFRLATSDPDLMEREPVKLWLEQVTTLMRDVFARSNTYRALHSVYEELGAYGTAATIVLPDFEDVIHHHPLTIGEYLLAADARGDVTTLYREWEMTVAQMVKDYGLDNCSAAVQNLYDRGKGLDSWVRVVNVIEPRTDRDPRGKGPRDMAWSSCHFEYAGQENKLLREGGFRRFRALCPRWATSGGDIYGSSPGMEALGDVKQLQHQQLRKAQGIDYKVRPPLQIPAALKNVPLATMPGGGNFVDAQGPQQGIRAAWDVDLDLGHLLEDIRDVRGRINATFYADLFLMLAQNADNPQMTAREVAERHEEKLLVLGPVLERLHNELLKPKIDLTFDSLLEAGALPPPPEELHAQDLNVEFVSMLAQAQRAVGTSSVDRLLNTVGTIAVFQAKAGQPPSVLDKLDTDQIVDEYADMLGVDPRLIVADEKVAIVRKARAQAQQKTQEAALAQQAAESAKTLSQADTSGQNALTDISKRLTGYSTPAAGV